MYADVKEIYPGAADRLQTKLRQLATTAAGQSPSDQPSPSIPPQAHLPPSNSGRSTSPQQQILSGQNQSLANLFSSNTTSQDGSQIRQYLLLCVNTKRLRTLEHIEVTRRTNDQEPFRDIYGIYKQIRKSEDWRLSEFIPSWAPIPTWIVSHLEDVSFLVPKSATFVKVCILVKLPVYQRFRFIQLTIVVLSCSYKDEDLSFRPPTSISTS